MNKNILSLLAALSALTAVGADSFPYHPFRRIGTNSYDLRLLYTWRANMSAQRAAANSGQSVAIYRSAMEACPMPSWLLPRSRFGGGFVVAEIWQPNLLLLRPTAAELGSIVLKNHPNHDELTDGQPIACYALRTGNHQWTDRLGSTHTIPLYDYGTPYNPFAPKQATNAPGKAKP